MIELRWRLLLFLGFLIGLMASACSPVPAEEIPVAEEEALPEVETQEEPIESSSYQLGQDTLVRVHTTAGDRLRLREAPGFDAAILKSLTNGQILQVFEGPEPADGHVWWLVQATDGLLEGWAVEAVDGINTLVPLPLLDVYQGDARVNGELVSGDVRFLDFGDQVVIEPGGQADILWDAASWTTLFEGSEVEIIDTGGIEPHVSSRGSGFLSPMERHWFLHGLFGGRGESKTTVESPPDLRKIFKYLLTGRRMAQARGTAFSVIIPDDQIQILVIVDEGSVEVTTMTDEGEFTELVGAGEGASLLEGQPPIIFEAAEGIPTVEVGVGSIRGTVWRDFGEIGVIEAGESRYAGVVVQLYDRTCELLLDRQITDEGGDYVFAELPPDVYCVRVIEEALPPATYGYSVTFPPEVSELSPAWLVEVFAGEIIEGLNFGFQEIIG